VINIPGKPIGKKRPRFARAGKFVKTYNDQQTEEGLFMWHLQQQWKQEPLERPISMKMRFVMPIPKGTSATRSFSMMDSEHTKKPDLDNLIKFVKDCCNEIVWRDDSLVWQIDAVKVYGYPARTEIEIL
jgi:Holliday junction resolvase RusA-like endonuclease